MKKLRKRISSALIAAVLLIAVSAGVAVHFRPHLGYIAGEYLGLYTQKLTVAGCPVETQSRTVESLKSDARVSFDQSLMLVNTEHKLSDDFAPDLKEYKNSGVIMNACMLEAYSSLSAAVSEKTGQPLYVMSSVRSADEQKKLYSQYPDTAVPTGASEHQTGLGLDVYTKKFSGEGFIKSDAGQFVNSYSWQYGFIMRYPSYGKGQTKVKFEPWHIRYVGQPHAKVIYNNHLTLEKYIDSLEPDEWYSVDGYLVSRQEEGSALDMPRSFAEAVISPDNTGYVIITVRQ